MSHLVLTIVDAFRRLTAREFIIGVGLYVLLILNFECGYGLSEEMVGLIIGGMLVGAAWRIAQKP